MDIRVKIYRHYIDFAENQYDSKFYFLETVTCFICDPGLPATLRFYLSVGAQTTSSVFLNGYGLLDKLVHARVKLIKVTPGLTINSVSQSKVSILLTHYLENVTVVFFNTRLTKYRFRT